MTDLLPFTVQSTAALFTLLALLVPLIIHLLSKSRGTLVPFAHIALIKKIKSQPMQRIRLVQRLLLFLRMMILVLAALLLAHLFYLGSPEQAPRQVLLSPQWLTQASSAEKQRVATVLPETGATLLTAPLQTLSAAQMLTWQPPASGHNQGQTDNVWARVNAYLSDIPVDTEVEIYTSNSASQFVGEKPSFRHNLQWHIQALPPQPVDAGQIDINIVVLYDSDRSEDLTYIQAALAALQKNTAIKLVVDAFPRSALGDDHSALGDDHSALANNTSLSAADVIVYLSSEALTAELLALISQGRVLLMDAAQPHSEGHWSAATKDALALTGTRLGSPAPLGLTDSASSSQLATTEILWQTDNQQTALTEQGLAQGHIIALHSRFNPSWSNLVAQPAFPLQLARWLLTRQSEQLMLQQARLSDKQIQSGPAQQTAMASRDHVPRQHTSLTPLLAWLLLLFFAAERLLSEWQRSKPQRPKPHRSKPQRPKPGGDL